MASKLITGVMKKTYWIRTADTKVPSSSLTLAVITWAVIMLWLFCSIFAPMFDLEILPFDAAEAMMILSPILLNYYGRRHTSAKKKEQAELQPEQNEQ